MGNYGELWGIMRMWEWVGMGGNGWEWVSHSTHTSAHHKPEKSVGAPEPKQYFLGLYNSNMTIPGIQKHLCWPVGHSGMGGRGTTLEPKQYFLALYSSNTSSKWGEGVRPPSTLCRTPGTLRTYIALGPNNRNQKIWFGFWGGAPDTHTSAHHGPAKVVLDA